MLYFQDTETAGKTEGEIYLEWPVGTEVAEGISGLDAGRHHRVISPIRRKRR